MSAELQRSQRQAVGREIQTLHRARSAAQHRRGLAGQGVVQDAVPGPAGEVAEGDKAAHLEPCPAPRAETVEPFVGESQKYLGVRVGKSQSIEHLVCRHHHQRSGDRLPRNIAVDHCMLPRSAPRQLGEEITADLTGRPAHRCQRPAIGRHQILRQKRGLDRGRDLELAFELRLAGTLVDQEAGLQRDRGLVEETAHELQLLVLECGLAGLTGE